MAPDPLKCGGCSREIVWEEIRFEAQWVRGSEIIRQITRCLNCTTEGAEKEN